jgi:hypothetical protein
LASDPCRASEPDLVVVPTVDPAPAERGADEALVEHRSSGVRVEHRAACHFATEVNRGDHGLLFSDGVVDTEAP